MREKSLPSPRADIILSREFQYLVFVALAFPNVGYFTITSTDLSTAFFQVFRYRLSFSFSGRFFVLAKI